MKKFYKILIFPVFLLSFIFLSKPVSAVNSINKIGWFNSHYSVAGKDYDISYNPLGSSPRVVDYVGKSSEPNHVNISRQVVWFSLPQSGAVNKRSLKFDFKLTYWPSPNSLFWDCRKSVFPNLDISVDGVVGKGVVSNFSCNSFLENHNSVVVLSGSVFFSPEGGFVKDPYFRLFIGFYDSHSTSANSFITNTTILFGEVPNFKLNYFDISNIEFYSDPNTQFLNNLMVQNQTIINQNEQMINAQNQTNNFLTDKTPPNVDTNKTPSVGLLPAGPFDTILNLPLNILTVINSSLGGNCQSIVLPLPFVNNKLQLPCFSETIYKGDFKVALDSLSVPIVAIMLFYYLKHIKLKFERAISMEASENDEWGIL